MPSQKYLFLEQTVKDLYGMRPNEEPETFHKILLSITLQMTRTERSVQMLDLLFQNYGSIIVFDHHTIRAWPSAETLSRANEEEMKTKCNLGYRAKWIKAAAEDFCSGKIPSWNQLKGMTPEKAKQELMKIKGIGKYSADIITPHPSFPVDVWSVKIFYKLFFRKELKKDPRLSIPIVRKYSEKEWGKWQTYAFTYILNDLNNLSKKFQL